MNQTFKKILLCTGVLTLTLTGCGSSSSDNEKKLDKEETKVTLQTNSLYVEPLNPSNAQIKAFNKLSKAVENLDEENEAKMAAVGFAFDFFTLSNKSGSDDVGGLQFIPTTMVFRFKEFAQAYYYSNYGTIVNTYGKDSLPEVTSYKVTSIEASDLSYNDKACTGYVVDMTLNYADTDVEAKSLKKKITVTVASLSDYPFDRSKTYKDNEDFTGELINAYRVLSVE